MNDDPSASEASRRAAPPVRGSREERLAAALRANLTRRKAQARARGAQDQTNENEAATGPEGNA